MPSGAAQSSAPPQEAAKVGDTLQLAGEDGTLKVKLVRVFPDAQQKGAAPNPQSENRFYAAEVAIKNVGAAAYEGVPTNSAVVVDSTGQQFNPIIVTLEEGVDMGRITMTPGSLRRGLVAFEVPRSVTIDLFQLGLAGGTTGEWKVR